MTDQDIDLLARLTAIEQTLAFLMAKNLSALSDSESEAVKKTFFGHPNTLATGMMDSVLLEEIGKRVDIAQDRILEHASELRAAWKGQAHKF